jgi:hypothetical protein
MKTLKCILPVLLGVLATSGAAVVADPGPQWPLDLDTRYLTSNFMEYRPGRFHAGIDLKTRSLKGFPALAAEDGWILRVRATPFAYGRAVYLRGVSGRTYVYAHLDRFNDVIRTRIRAERERTGLYRVRLSFAPDEIPVRRGDVLGLTGESGTLGPHLHFEVRDEKNRPINPLLAGFAVPDTMAPVVHAVRALPASPDSRIEGLGQAAILEPGDGLPLTGEQPALRLSGPVAFSARIDDASDIRGHKLEPWLIEVRLDGDPVYRCTNDVYDFAENSLQRLEWLELPEIRDRWLHRRPANTLAGREGGLWYLGDDGRGLVPGRHLLEIVAADQAGNQVSLAIPLQVGGDAVTAAAASGGWRSEPVRLTAGDGKASPEAYLAPFFQVVGEGVDGFDLVQLDTGAGDPVHAVTTLGRRSVQLDPDQLNRAGAQGLRPLGPGVDFMTADWPIEAAVVVELPGYGTGGIDSSTVVSDPAVMAYRWHRGKWRTADRLMGPLTAGGPPRLPLASPGLYAVFRDEKEPAIEVPQDVLGVGLLEPSTVRGVTLPRWEIFPVGVLDLGSGIAPESITATLDGRPLIVEPDLPRDRVLVELPDDCPPGRHELALNVRDEAGHRAEATLTIECRP